MSDSCCVAAQLECIITMLANDVWCPRYLTSTIKPLPPSSKAPTFPSLLIVSSHCSLSHTPNCPNPIFCLLPPPSALLQLYSLPPPSLVAFPWEWPTLLTSISLYVPF